MPMTRIGRSRRHRTAALVAVLVAATIAVASGSPAAGDGNEAPGGPAAYRAITAGARHTCAILDSGALKCWGYNGVGALGLGDTSARGKTSASMGDNLPAVDLGTGRTATAVSAGASHTCAVLDNGWVKCWGWGVDGQLGLGVGGPSVHRGSAPGEMGDNLPPVDLGTGRTAVALAAGSSHNCVILDDASVKCWGLNNQGQIGFGGGPAVGDEPGEMGEALPRVDLGTGRTAVAITAGDLHSCALLDNATVKCWGDNAHGELGQGDTVDRGPMGPSQMGDLLPAIDLGTGRTATAIASAHHSTCALLDNGSVKCWGDGASGQLGLGNTTARGNDPSEMGDNLPPVALGSGRTATAVTTGRASACALLDNASVKCWGANSFGQLGLGDNVSRGDNALEMGDDLPPVPLSASADAVAITSGANHRCARLSSGALKCWGDNTDGALGVGDVWHRGDVPGEMGDYLPAVRLTNAPPPSGVSGTITDAGTGSPLPGAWVALLRTTDFAVVGGAVADASGAYIAPSPAGTYFLYLIDPGGGHAPGFHGSPTVVTVPPSTIVDVDPAMVGTTGTIGGTVTDVDTDTPIPGAFVIESNPATAAPQTGAAANAAGQFTLPSLRSGGHVLVALDPSGAHSPRYHPDAPGPGGAVPVGVLPGATATADVALPAQPSGSGSNALTGIVTESGTGTPIGGAFVLALRAADFSLARGGLTTGTGAYALTVPDGAYHLIFLDPTARHDMEWHLDRPYYEIANAVAVTAPANTNAALNANTGRMLGTVTDSLSANPIAGAWVIAIGPTGIQAGAVTSGNGNYSITGLPAGTYRATVLDPTALHRQEYWQDAATYDGATAFAVTGGGTTTINAALERP